MLSNPIQSVILSGKNYFGVFLHICSYVCLKLTGYGMTAREEHLFTVVTALMAT